MQFEDIDTNLKYLILTLLLLIPVVAAHNLTGFYSVSVPGSETSFAMCDISTHCQGVEAGNICLGIQQRDVSCVDPRNASEYRRVEAECGLDAQAICNANPELEGLEWTDNPNATYDGRSCQEWADGDERIDLLKCEQTFDDITKWSGADGR